MALRALLVPRRPTMDTIIHDDALETLAEELRVRGSVEIVDADGDRHTCRIGQVTITPLGIEATFDILFPAAKVTTLTFDSEAP